MSDEHEPPQRNDLLRGLPPGEREEVGQRRRPSAFAPPEVVDERCGPVERVIFPVTGVFSLIAQIPGQALAMAVGPFLEVATNGGEFQRRLQRYTLALLTQIAQGAACNRLHAIEERCARWLQRAGFISYARGRIRVLGRRGLEDAACECYAVVRDEFRRLVELAEHG